MADQMDDLKKMAMKQSKYVQDETAVKSKLTTRASAIELQAEEREPRSTEEFLDRLNSKIVKMKSFRTGKIDNYGVVSGIRECEPGKVPHVHQNHYYDAFDRVIKLEMFEKDFTRPRLRIYFYEGESNKVSESVWLDRYHQIENIHRYFYDPETGLMTDRAEYNREGEIFYQIHSDYDLSHSPPLLVQELWRDKYERQIQRYVYKHDEDGDPVMEIKHDSGDNLIGYYKYQYDAKKENLVKKEWFGPDDKMRSYFVYEYDEDDNNIRVTLYDGEGKKESSQEFIYDKVGNIMQERWYNGEDQLFKQLIFQI